MKEFEQPKFDISKSDVSDNFGRFTVAPLEKGFGVTVGNALRRVFLDLLSTASRLKERDTSTLLLKASSKISLRSFSTSRTLS